MNRLTTTTAAALCLAGIQTFAAEPEPTAQWISSASVGLTLTRGNSKTVLGTANVITAKKWDKNELSFGADAAYGEDEDSTTAQSLRAFGQYNRLFTERFYGFGRVDFLYDKVADIDYRITISPGAGYYFIKNERTDLSGEVGPSAVIESAGGNEQTYFALRVGEKYNFKINDRARIWQSAEYLPEVEDFNNYILNLEVGIESDLTEKMSLRSFIRDTYDNQPAEGRQKNDLKWVTAIAYKF